MTKLQFLFSLSEHLSSLPSEEKDENLEFYAEIIEDKMEEGLSEEEAVTSVGSPEELAAQILANHPKKKTSKKQKLKAWEIVLLAVGSPIWASLLIAAFAVAVSLYAVLWSVIVTLWACFAAFCACGIYGMIFGIGTAVSGNTITGMAFIGAGICCGGLGIFLFFGCKAATIGTALLTKNIFLWIKNQFTHKEDAQ